MQSVNWEQIKELLDEVLQIRPAERQEFIQNSGYPQEVRDEVESLIAFEDKAENLMNLSAIEFSKDFFDKEIDSADTFVGQQIGVYRIVHELGMGGMGAVYLAERNDGKIEQKAAIKMLKREFNVEKIRHSFKRERVILAKLNHPNIAHLFDAGTTEDGIPYLIMEYIEGETIDNFCEHNNLSLKKRLKLFNKVCEAVSFAHQNLIIHRDLKPSNILVTATGEVKLLDFGISKILNDEQTEEKNTVTMMGAMTPEYASPEQVKGEKVTTSTDIYSLGVVLYKILTGNLPYNLANKTNGNLLKVITETEPAIPSAQNTNPQSAIRNPQLKGDIDNIILKSLRKEPDRRYQTVEQFSADIWRFIDGLPVLARPATVSYRASKFFQRNKISVVAGVLIFVSLIAGIAVAMRQTHVAREQARVASESQKVALAEAEKAKAEQIKAEKVSKFMMKIIRYANPRWYAEGYKFKGEARVIEALDDMVSKIDTEFADQPDVLAELHHHFGDAYLTRGEPGGKEKSRLHFERAFELRRKHYSDWHELLAKDMVYLYWTRPDPKNTTDADARLLSDAIVMMRATNPKNLNLPFMLETYFHNLIADDKPDFNDIFLRNVPQPAPNDKYLAADQLFDEMLGLLRFHFPEDNNSIIIQKCAGMIIKRKVNKITEAEEFYQVCKAASEYGISIGKPNATWQKWLDAYERVRAEKGLGRENNIN